MNPSTSSLALVLTLLAGTASAQFCPLGETERRIVTCKDGVTMAECRDEAQKVGCTVVRELALVHAVVIEIPTSRMFIAEAKLAAAPKVARSDADGKVRWLRNLPDSGFNGIDMGDITRRIADLKPAFPAPAAEASPKIPWGIKRVGAPEVWSRTEGKGAVVAVIDTGIDGGHPDLKGQVLGGVNITDPQHPDAWQDDEGHGTHVSGTIAGKGLGGGLAGVAPQAKLYAVKVLDKDGNGNYDDVIAGIQWAVEHGAKIANMSLGADEGSEPLHAAVKAALAKGMLIVAAAGNSGASVGYPGAYPETVAVGASDKNDKAADFSSHGPEVDYIAPGVDVLSAKLGGGYTTLSGTSMATPHIAGLAALAYSLGSTTPSALRASLDRAARPLDGLSPDNEGRGMVLAGGLGEHGLLGDGNSRLAMASTR